MVEFGKLTLPYPSSALPPQDSINAAPKCISGRTSYLRVRLAFHPYPQLIPAFCTRHGFGPPRRYYLCFNLAMGRSPGFGSNPDNTPDIMETRPPESIKNVTSVRQVEPPTACKSTVSGLFHSPPGVLFTFPSRYWFTIGGQGYLALEGGPPRFPQDFTCPVVLNKMPRVFYLSSTGLSPSMVIPSRFVRLDRNFIKLFVSF